MVWTKLRLLYLLTMCLLYRNNRRVNSWWHKRNKVAIHIHFLPLVHRTWHILRVGLNLIMIKERLLKLLLWHSKPLKLPTRKHLIISNAPHSNYPCVHMVLHLKLWIRHHRVVVCLKLLHLWLLEKLLVDSHLGVEKIPHILHVLVLLLLPDKVLRLRHLLLLRLHLLLRSVLLTLYGILLLLLLLFVLPNKLPWIESGVDFIVATFDV